MEVVLLVGLQGSGKSTFYRAHFAATHVLVSKDLLRNNRRPRRRQMQLVEEALQEGRSVVVDNTNPTIEDRAPLIDLARRHGADVVGVYFVPQLDACLERNRSRTGRGRVPDKALYITLNRLHPPTLGEGFDRLYRASVAPEGGFHVEDVRGRWGDEGPGPRRSPGGAC
jgi:predicted kinase